MSDEARFDLSFQIGQLDLTAKKLEELAAKAHADLSEAEIALVGVALQSFYNGVEGCNRLVLHSRGRSLPSGGRWHTSFLDMALESNDEYPALLPDEVASALRPLLAFRHVFRNTYFFEIDGTRAIELARHAAVWWPQIRVRLSDAMAPD